MTILSVVVGLCERAFATDGVQTCSRKEIPAAWHHVAQDSEEPLRQLTVRLQRARQPGRMRLLVFDQSLTKAPSRAE